MSVLYKVVITYHGEEEYNGVIPRNEIADTISVRMGREIDEEQIDALIEGEKVPKFYKQVSITRIIPNPRPTGATKKPSSSTSDKAKPTPKKSKKEEETEEEEEDEEEIQSDVGEEEIKHDSYITKDTEALQVICNYIFNNLYKIGRAHV